MLRAAPGPGNTVLARRLVYLVAVFGLATVVGLALTRLDPLLVAGALIGAVLVTLVLLLVLNVLTNHRLIQTHRAYTIAA